MTPVGAVSAAVLGALRANATVIASTAANPAGGAGVYHMEMPQGESFLPCLVYSLVASADVQAQGESHVSVYSVMVIAHAVGESVPYALAEAAEDVLKNLRVVQNGYVINFERSGDLPAGNQKVDGREFRRAGIRFTARAEWPIV